MTHPIQDQECPLCGTSAKFYFADFNNRKHFQCGHCTEFQISTGAEERLTESPLQQRRANFSQKARQAQTGRVLVITLAPIPHGRSVAYPVFDDKYVLREELLGQGA